MIRFIRALRRSQTNSRGVDYFEIFDWMRMSLTVTIPSISWGSRLRKIAAVFYNETPWRLRGRADVGSYPNFLFDVEAEQIEAFAEALAAVRSAADFEAFVERFGVRRTSPRPWTTFDWIHDDFRRRQPTQAGLFDLNRYGNF